MSTSTPHADKPAVVPGVLGPEFTDGVIASIGPGASPRLREVMAGLIRHVHDFAREVHLTHPEWLAAVDLINRAGRMSDGKRNEGQLLCDVIGLESLVDNITYQAATAAGQTGPTASAILGPFWRADTPARPNGSTITFDTPVDASVVYMHGVVSCSKTGKPIVGAAVDVWQASTNGMYEQQDPKQREYNLRGVFTTDEQGRYSLYCIRPTPYPVPSDGPAGELLKMLDRHPWRPAHIHLMVRAENFNPITTQIFDKDSKYLDNDSVFAVKDDLAVDFKPRDGDDQAKLELQYDVRLEPSA
ncbi:hydroxyquinol 1,2-dioxygenase [Magnaporthiopsis poae ATCC 64411]|uniref:Hydroxyquinol 1,2-dioxygenase n=1 Tax=Magnaporthiopsis poae (strain ATCC 64411 / 73-15) TaxID=644358 RepID=A0A0C4EG39_MAGP6|nr:hydroxyquinol 1,2-dioxygenase [Magnaporthiopsis poae ATCC 64411]